MIALDKILAEASANISEEYFQLPIDGAENPIYRERVYCYELYHQMRMRWPFGTKYSLSGEVDKSGHPLIRGNGLDNIKPDFLVHTPGDMNGNFSIIEIKPANAELPAIHKDIATLTAFLEHARYRRGLCYVYGWKAEALISRVSGEIDERIEFWAHSSPGAAARRIP